MENKIDDKLKQLFEQLGYTGTSVKIAIETYPVETIEYLEGKKGLPDGCPSRASMAEMALSRVYKNIKDAEATYEAIIKHIRENYNYK